MGRLSIAMLAASLCVLPACGGEDPATPDEGQAEAVAAESSDVGSVSGRSTEQVTATPIADGGVPVVGGVHPTGRFPGCDNCPIVSAPEERLAPASR